MDANESGTPGPHDTMDDGDDDFEHGDSASNTGVALPSHTEDINRRPRMLNPSKAMGRPLHEENDEANLPSSVDEPEARKKALSRASSARHRAKRYNEMRAVQRGHLRGRSIRSQLPEETLRQLRAQPQIYRVEVDDDAGEALPTGEDALLGDTADLAESAGPGEISYDPFHDDSAFETQQSLPEAPQHYASVQDSHALTLLPLTVCRTRKRSP